MLYCLLLDIIIDKIITKILIWAPRSQYASLAPLITINEIFSLRIFESKGNLRYGYSIIYASIGIILCIIYLYIALRRNYEGWPAYAEITFKFFLFIIVIVVMIFIILGMMNTKVSISKAIIIKYSKKIIRLLLQNINAI